MVAQRAVVEHERTRRDEEPPERIVLSPRDAAAVLAALRRPAAVNPQTVEQLKKDALFRERHGIESAR